MAQSTTLSHISNQPGILSDKEELLRGLNQVVDALTGVTVTPITIAGQLKYTFGTPGAAKVLTAAAETGTVTTNGSVTLTGSGTTFLSTAKIGGYIWVTSETVRTIATITSDTSLTVTTAFSTSTAGLTYSVGNATWGTGIAGAATSVSNTGDVSITADSDSSGAGAIKFNIGASEKASIGQNGRLTIGAALDFNNQGAVNAGGTWTLASTMSLSGNGVVIGVVATSTRPLSVYGEVGGTDPLAIYQYSTDAYGPGITSAKARGGFTAPATPTDVQAEDSLGGFFFYGYKDGSFRTAGIFDSVVESVNTNVVNPYFRFRTYTAGVISEVARITNAGYLGIGDFSASDPLYPLHVAGNAAVNDNLYGVGNLGLSSLVGYVHLLTPAAQHMYFDCGGNFYWRDVDDSSAVRMAFDSANGRLSIGTGAPTAVELSTLGPGTAATGVTNYHASFGDTTAMAQNVGAALVLAGRHTAGGMTEFAAIKGHKENATDGNTAGALVFYTRPAAGSLTEAGRFTSTGLFRVIDGTSSLPAIAFSSDPDTGLYRPALGKLGLVANGAVGIVIDSTSGYPMVGMGTATPLRTFHTAYESGLDNSIQTVARYTHTTIATPVAGIGVGIEFEQMTSSGNNEVISLIGSEMTDVTLGSEDADLVFYLMAGGATASEKMRVSSAGNLTLPGTVDGVDVAAHAADANAHHAQAHAVASADHSDWPAGLTAAELGYVADVTSLIQAQLNAKQGTLTNSAGLAAALSDETGSGLAVFGTSPTITTPVLSGGHYGDGLAAQRNPIWTFNSNPANSGYGFSYYEANPDYFAFHAANNPTSPDMAIFGGGLLRISYAAAAGAQTVGFQKLSTTVGVLGFTGLLGRGLTVVVAASNATDAEKAGADYICNGTADEEEIQAAIDFLYGTEAAPKLGGTILLTSGTYNIASKINLYRVSPNPLTANVWVGVSVVGVGPSSADNGIPLGGTILKAASALGTGDVIQIGVGSTYSHAVPSVQSLTIDTAYDRVNTGGTADAPLSAGIRAYKSRYGIIRDVQIWRQFVGIITETGADDLELDNVKVDDSGIPVIKAAPAANALGIYLKGGTPYLLRVRCTNDWPTCNSTYRARAGVRILTSTRISNCEFNGFEYTGIIDPYSGTLENVFINDTFFDINTNAALRIAPTSTGLIKTVTIQDTWMSSATATDGTYGWGLMIDGPNAAATDVQDVQIQNCYFTNTTKGGITLNKCSFVQISGCHIVGRAGSYGITASKSGTTVTATAGYAFVAGDVGGYIVWGAPANTTDTITGFTSPTVVTVSASATIASQAATVSEGIGISVNNTCNYVQITGTHIGKGSGANGWGTGLSIGTATNVSYGSLTFDNCTADISDSASGHPSHYSSSPLYLTSVDNSSIGGEIHFPKWGATYTTDMTFDRYQNTFRAIYGATVLSTIDSLGHLSTYGYMYPGTALAIQSNDYFYQKSAGLLAPNNGFSSKDLRVHGATGTYHTGYCGGLQFESTSISNFWGVSMLAADGALHFLHGTSWAPTVRYKFGTDGTALADVAWNTFSPKPPKEDMSPEDYLDWALEHANKPVKPYDGIPEDPAEFEKYVKDPARIAIGSARYLGYARDRITQLEARVAELEARLN